MSSSALSNMCRWLYIVGGGEMVLLGQMGLACLLNPWILGQLNGEGGSSFVMAGVVIGGGSMVVCGGGGRGGVVRARLNLFLQRILRRAFRAASLAIVGVRGGGDGGVDFIGDGGGGSGSGCGDGGGSGSGCDGAGLGDAGTGLCILSLYRCVHASCSAFRILYFSFFDMCLASFLLRFRFGLTTLRLLLPAWKNMAWASRSRYLFAALDRGVSAVVVVGFLSKMVVSCLKQRCGAHPGTESDILMLIFAGLSRGSCLMAATSRLHLVLLDFLQKWSIFLLYVL